MGHGDSKSSLCENTCLHPLPLSTGSQCHFSLQTQPYYYRFYEKCGSM